MLRSDDPCHRISSMNESKSFHFSGSNSCHGMELLVDDVWGFFLEFMEFRAPVLLTVRKYDVQETLESDSPKGQALTHVWRFATSEPAAGDKNYFHKGRNVSHRNSSSCPPFKNISFFIHLFILGNLFTQVGFELRTLRSHGLQTDPATCPSPAC